jgi:hypothetical protein
MRYRAGAPPIGGISEHCPQFEGSRRVFPPDGQKPLKTVGQTCGALAPPRLILAFTRQPAVIARRGVQQHL